MDITKKRLLGLTPTELKTVVAEFGMPAFTAKQITQWLYEKHAKSIDEMTNISKANRARLAESYEVGCAAPIDAQHSKDGTIKYLFPVQTTRPDDSQPVKFVETVYIPDDDRATLCVSCEV